MWLVDPIAVLIGSQATPDGYPAGVLEHGSESLSYRRRPSPDCPLFEPPRHVAAVVGPTTEGAISSCGGPSGKRDTVTIQLSPR
jgi:hypothetical protein